MRARVLPVAVLAVVTSLATVASPFAPAAYADPATAETAPGGLRLALTTEVLRDLRPDVADPTDGARATAFAVTTPWATGVVLVVHDLDRAAAGRTLGAHVHVGPCVAGAGAAAGPHYTHRPPPSPFTEIWLDLTVGRRGSASATAFVPFGLPPGAAGSIVVHERPTAPDGTAGARLACLPFSL
jgi:Cu/Zn superoxide dismutase